MTVRDTFRIKGRGVVACVETDGPCPLNGSQLRRVSDGQTWTVCGVERFGAKLGAVGEAGERVGILVSAGVEPAAGDEIERIPATKP